MSAGATVTILFFASLREAVGRDAMELDLDEPRIADIRVKLASVLTVDAFRAVSAQGVQVCVNHTIVRGDAEVRSGDEIAFLPPVTGG